jgi:mono/diheme cytochrome c family protein
MDSNSQFIRSVQCLLILAAAVACGGEPKARGTDTAAAAVTPTPTTGAAGASAPTPGAPPAGATAQMVALGDSIFHGQAAGGLCFTCHGPDANGTQLAPPLVSHKWLTGDGTYAFIQQRVTEGMPKPTPPYVGPMLPMGGAHLTPDQIKSVAAYVYSISHSGS